MTTTSARSAATQQQTRMARAKDFSFIGRLCLDFAQTGDMGWGTRYERLTSPAELGRWLTLSPLHVSVATIADADLAQAIDLRAAIWRIAQALLAGGIPRVADIRRLNGEARRPPLVRALSADGASLRWHQPTVDAALATIAHDAVLLFGDAQQRARLRRCENAGCHVVFFDDSRPGARRWCAANRCGDRMRAREYRRRHTRTTSSSRYAGISRPSGA
jgi:predicted RNA-binding Zn ribbon-like protein